MMQTTYPSAVIGGVNGQQCVPETKRAAALLTNKNKLHPDNIVEDEEGGDEFKTEFGWEQKNAHDANARSSRWARRRRDARRAGKEKRRSVRTVSTTDADHEGFEVCTTLPPTRGQEGDLSWTSAPSTQSPFTAVTIDTLTAITTTTVLSTSSQATKKPHRIVETVFAIWGLQKHVFEFAATCTKDIIALASVSKEWQRYARNCDYLIKEEKPSDDYACDAIAQTLGAMVDRLQSLQLRNWSSLHDSGFVALNHLRQVRELDLYGCTELTDASLLPLFENTLGLRNLGLNRCSKITDQSVKALARLPHLKSLDLWHCSQVTDEGVEALSSLECLQVLLLNECPKVTDRSLRAVAKLPCLKTLELYRCNITNAGLTTLAQAARTSEQRLRSLNLTYCSLIDDSGCVSLSQMPSLTSLDLGGCSKITDVGLRALCTPAPPATCTLEKLSVWGLIQITNDGVALTADVKTLKKLSLWGCPKVVKKPFPVGRARARRHRRSSV